MTATPCPETMACPIPFALYAAATTAWERLEGTALFAAEDHLLARFAKTHGCAACSRLAVATRGVGNLVNGDGMGMGVRR